MLLINSWMLYRVLKNLKQKRKTIGRVFIEVFDQEATLIEDVKWFGTGDHLP